RLRSPGSPLFPYTTLFRSALASGTQAVLDMGDGRFQTLDTDRALFQRPLHAGTQLVLVERLAAAVLLDQPRHHQFSGFESGETRSEEHTSELQSRENLVCR